jgi:hypothetical protein
MPFAVMNHTRFIGQKYVANALTFDFLELRIDSRFFEGKCAISEQLFLFAAQFHRFWIIG